MLLCPICGEQYSEPPAVSRTDEHTPICSSCGIRESLDPLVKAKVMKVEDMERIVEQNMEMYRQYNEQHNHACV